MHHQGLETQSIGAAKLVYQCVDRLLPELLIRTAQIDEIGIVADRPHKFGLLQRRFEQGHLLIC